MIYGYNDSDPENKDGRLEVLHLVASPDVLIKLADFLRKTAEQLEMADRDKKLHSEWHKHADDSLCKNLECDVAVYQHKIDPGSAQVDPDEWDDNDAMLL